MGEVIKRNGGWSIRWYEGGRRRIRASRQPTHAAARRMLLEIEARIARGEAGIPERRAAREHTVAELIERFCAEYSRPRLKDLDRYRSEARSRLRQVVPHLGPQAAAAVTSRDVARLRDALGRSLAPGTVRNVLTALSSLYTWAVREELVTHNPCRGVERPLTQSSLDFFTAEETERLLQAAEAQLEPLLGHRLYVAIMLALHVGLRKGELCGLRWQDIDLDGRHLTIARSFDTTPKSGKPRHLRLPSELLPVLAAWRRRCPPSAEGLVLPVNGGVAHRGISLGLPRLLARIGLRQPAHPWHALRHTFGSHYIMQGGNVLALQKILGHADIGMTLLYAHLLPDYLGDEMDRVRFRKREAQEPPSASSPPARLASTRVTRRTRSG